MDSACKVWQEICGSQGNCWIYEKTDMGIKLFVWWIIVKILSLTFNFAAQYFYNPPHEECDDHSQSNGEKKALTDANDEDACKESVIWTWVLLHEKSG